METSLLNIMAILAVAFAFFLAGKSMVTKLLAKPKTDCNSGCGGCTTKCDLHQLTEKAKHNHH